MLNILNQIDPAEFYQKHLQDCSLANVRGDWCNSGLCTFHYDRNVGSFGFNIKSGAFNCFSCGASGGSVIAFIMQLRNFSFRETVQYLFNGNYSKFDYPGQIVAKANSSDHKTTQMIQQIWRESLPAEGTIVEEYLRIRGYLGAIPPTIRFHPKLYHSDTKKFYPAMIGAVCCFPDRTITALHRTYLSNGRGKTEVPNNKKMLGATKGGVVRLAPLCGNTLAMAEGIETSLSFQEMTGIPTWSTLSTSGLKNFIPPSLELIQEIVIAADNDEAGLEAAKKATNRLEEAGYKVNVFHPTTCKDFADLILIKNQHLT